MSGLVLVALALSSLWLGVLTLVVVLIIRQIGLLTVRLDHTGTGPVVDPHNDGPSLGSRIPQGVYALLPELDAGPTTVVLVSAGCSPCRALVAELEGHEFAGERPIVALVPGHDGLAQGLVAMLPPGIRAVCDPNATTIAQSLQLHSTPFALAVEDGAVARKGYLHNATDLLRIVKPIEATDAGTPSPGTALAKR